MITKSSKISYTLDATYTRFMGIDITSDVCLGNSLDHRVPSIALSNRCRLSRLVSITTSWSVTVFGDDIKLARHNAQYQYVVEPAMTRG